MNEIAPTGSLHTRSQKVPASHAIDWYTRAFALFMRAPLMWTLLALGMIAIWILLGLIPLLGQLALPLVMPVFVAAWQVAARKVEAGGTLELSDLLTGLQDKLAALIILGAIVLGASLLIVLTAGLVGMGAVVGGIAGGAADSDAGLMAAMGVGLLAILLGLVLSVLIGMAFWFAPALVVFRDVSPVNAITASFMANLKNIPAFLLFGILYLAAALLATIPAGLGWILLAPVVMLTTWTSYQDVFGDEAAAHAGASTG